jgi:hypothetical protein
MNILFFFASIACLFLGIFIPEKFFASELIHNWAQLIFLFFASIFSGYILNQLIPKIISDYAQKNLKNLKGFKGFIWGLAFVFSIVYWIIFVFLELFIIKEYPFLLICGTLTVSSFFGIYTFILFMFIDISSRE